MLSTQTNAIDAYKTIDKNGNVSFSGMPSKKSEKIEIIDNNKPIPNHETIYKKDCPYTVLESTICSIKIIEKRNDFILLRVHYHYKKGSEHSNTTIVRANNGSMDNHVGTQGGYILKMGNNTIDIPFGMYRAYDYTEKQPYTSNFIKVVALGITENGNEYTSPHIFNVTVNYNYSWYIIGEKNTWQ